MISEIEKAVAKFEKGKQTEKKLKALIDSGAKIKEMKGNQWVESKVESLPVRFIRIHDRDESGVIQLCGIGIF